MSPPLLLQRLAVVAQLGIATTHAGDYPTRKGGSSFSSYGGDQQAYLDEKAAQKSVTVQESGLMYKARVAPAPPAPAPAPAAPPAADTRRLPNAQGRLVLQLVRRRPAADTSAPR
jgi:hypothetical protein